MKTTLITGGASGLGKGIAMKLLKNGEKVIVIGSSLANGENYIKEAKTLGAEKRAIFIKADLSLIDENLRVIEEVKNIVDSIDALIFCAAKHNQIYTETKEGFESTFALDYLSRFLLSYGLKEHLEKSKLPIILNICGTGMNGEVNWSDLQHKEKFKAQAVMMHGSRLNDLSAVGFHQNDSVKKIKYILYNPWAVQTAGMKSFYKNPLMWKLYKIIGKSVDKASEIIIKLLNNPPNILLSAYRELKQLPMNKSTYDKNNAEKLYNITTSIIKESSRD